ncbi:hypothetical protein AQUCO_00700747v1 [Aquilegia coerulea]|uniref:Uncharacterized protein n=1 Tax=Aquilegia coerulea TaxID=218851 RepID=A0A2G5ELG1_AQUCA|nr:hypothetical protein AQUCO_00700747v1 [Aquilegia coerulea]
MARYLHLIVYNYLHLVVYNDYFTYNRLKRFGLVQDDTHHVGSGSSPTFYYQMNKCQIHCDKDLQQDISFDENASYW